MTDGFDLVNTYFERCGQGQVAPILELYADDAVFFDAGAGPTTIRGREAIGEEVFKPLFAGIPDFSVETVHMIGDDRLVLCEVILHGTHAGTFAGIEATGRRLTWHSAGTWEIGADGKFTREGYFYDTATLLSQMAKSNTPAAFMTPTKED